MTYGLVIFDFDGTLADSFPWLSGVFNAVAAHFAFRRVNEAEGARRGATRPRVGSWGSWKRLGRAGRRGIALLYGAE